MLTCVIARNLFLTQSRCLTVIVVMGLAMAASCSSNERGSQLSSEPEVPDSVPEAEKESVSNYSCASVCVGLCGESGDLVCDGRSECRETNGIFACQCRVGYEESGSGCIGELHTPVCFSCIIISTSKGHKSITLPQALSYVYLYKKGFFFTSRARASPDWY